MKQRIISLLLALCLMLQAAPVFAGAASGQQVTAGNVTITAGGTASITLRAENFKDIALLEVQVFYDASALTLTSTANGSKLSGASVAVNPNEAGKVTLSAMSVTGISGTGNLLTLYFSTAADCTPGTYPITVTIGNVLDSSFAPVSVSGVSGSVTVNEPPATTEQYDVFLYYAQDENIPLQKDDIIQLQVVNINNKSFVSACFTVDYDPNVFAVESFQMESEMTKEGALHSVNTSVAGQIYVTYASDVATDAFFLFKVKLKVIGDMDGTTQISAQASNVYKEDLTAYKPGYSSTRQLKLKKLPVVADNPDVFLKSERMVVGQQSTSTLWLEGGSNVAAANFTVSYDPAVLRCVSVKIAEQPNETDLMIVINEEYAEGTIRFTYLNMDGVASKDVPMVDITWEPISSPAAHTVLTTGGSDVAALGGKAITLEYKTDTGCIFVATVQPATCQKAGLATYRCACGATAPDEVLPIIPQEQCTHYKVRFVDYDGTELSSGEYHLGDSVTVPDSPDRPTDGAFTYTFAGWDPSVTVCTGNATYTATYTATEIEHLDVFVDTDTPVDNEVVELPENLDLTEETVNEALNTSVTKGELAEVVENTVKETVEVTKEEAISALQTAGVYNPAGAAPSVEIRSYLAADYQAPVGNSMTVDLKAWYQVYAVQGSNSAKVGEAETLHTEDEAITITIVLPASFVEGKLGTATVKHYKDGGVLAETYENLTIDKNGDVYSITFINTKGFSDFKVIVENAPAPELATVFVNATLEEAVVLNFMMLESLYTPDIKIEAEKDGVPVAYTTDTYGGYFRVRVALNADEMCKPITVQIFGSNNEPITERKTRSVRDYGRTLLAGNYADKIYRAVIAMLDYGASAQLILNSGETNLANDVVKDAERAVFDGFWPAAETLETTSGGNIATNATLEERITLNFLITPSNMPDGCTFVVMKDGVEVEYEEDDYNGYHRVRVRLDAHEMLVPLTIYMKDSNGVTIESKTTTISEYGRKVLNKPETDIKYLRATVAMLDYGACAQLLLNESATELANAHITAEERQTYVVFD